MPIFSAGSASVSVVPDFSGAQKAITEFFAAQKDVHVAVKPDLSNADVVKTEAELNAMHGTAKVEVDKNHLSNSIADGIKLAMATSGLDKLGTLLTAGLKPAAFTALIGAATELGAALLPATGALALMPAALLAIAAPAATVLVGIQGVGAAFKALDTGNAQQIAKAMADLAPSAQQFVTQVHALGPAFTALRLDVQQTLFAGLGTAVTNLAAVALPVARAGMTGLAATMNTELRSTINQLSQDTGQFTIIWSNINQAFSVGATILPELTRSFVTLATIGSQFLPQIATAVGNVVGQFAAWVAEAAKTGLLATIIQNAINVLTELGKVAGNVISVVTAVFTAALPGGTLLLKLLVDVTGQLATFAHSADGQTALRAFFDGISSAIGLVLPALSNLVQAIVTSVLPQIGALARILAPIAATLLNQLADGFRAIGGILPSVASVVGALASAMAPLIPVIAQIVQALLPPLVKFLGDLAPIIGQVAQILGQVLLQAVKLIAPVLPVIADAFIAIAKAIVPLIQPLTSVALQLLPPLLNVVKALVPIIQSAVGVFAAIAGVFLQIVNATVLPLLVSLINGLAGGLKVLSPFLGPLAGIILAIVGAMKLWAAIQVVLNLLLDANPIGLLALAIAGLITVLGLVVTHWKAISDFLTGVWNGVVDFVTQHWQLLVAAIPGIGPVILAVITIIQNFGTIWHDVVAGLKTAWDATSGALSTAWSAFWTGLQVAAQIIWAGLTAAWSALTGALAAAWAATSGVLSGAWSAFWTAVTATAQAAWAAIQVAWSAFIGFLRSTYDAWSSALSGAWSAFWTAVTATAQAAWAAIQVAWSAFIGFLRSTYDAWSSALSGAWSAFWTAVTATAQAAWAAIQVAWSAFIGFLRSTYDAWSSALSAAWSAFWAAVTATAQAAWAAIQAAWSAFIGFLRSTYDAWSSALAAAWSAFWAAVTATAQAAWAAIQAAWSAFIGFLRSTYDAWSSALSGAWSAFWTAVTATAQAAWTAIQAAASAGLGLIRGAFDAFASGLSIAWGALWSGLQTAAGAAWSALQTAVQAPIKFIVNTVLNGMIGGIDDVMSFLKLPFSIPKITLGFAEGGFTGDGIFGTGGKYDPAGIVHAREFVVNQEQTAKYLPLLQAINSGTGGYADGGLVGGLPGYSVGGLVGEIAQLVIDPVGTIVSFVKDLIGSSLGDGPIAQMAIAVPTQVAPQIGGWVGDKIKGGLTAILNAGGAAAQAVLNALGSAAGAVASALGITTGGNVTVAGFSGPNAVARWSPQVLQVLSMLGRGSGESGAVLRRIQFESGGNPTAINLTDSNALAGDPSRGLMQVIMTTFNAYRDLALSSDIYDPLANIYAGSNYAVHRYGSLAAIDPLVMPHGYDTGGWLPPGYTTVYNGTGGFEAVLNQAQQGAVVNAVSQQQGGDYHHVQVFLGDKEITDLIDMRVAHQSSRDGRTIRSSR